MTNHTLIAQSKLVMYQNTNFALLLLLLFFPNQFDHKHIAHMHNSTAHTIVHAHTYKWSTQTNTTHKHQLHYCMTIFTKVFLCFSLCQKTHLRIVVGKYFNNTSLLTRSCSAKYKENTFHMHVWLNTHHTHNSDSNFQKPSTTSYFCVNHIFFAGSIFYMPNYTFMCIFRCGFQFVEHNSFQFCLIERYLNSHIYY